MLTVISQHKLLQQTSKDALGGEKGEKRGLHSEETTTSLRKSLDCEAHGQPQPLGEEQGS